jgi:hypothetical protein
MRHALQTVTRRTMLPLSIGLLGILLMLGFVGAAAAQSESPLKWSSAKLVDHARPYGDPAEIGGVSCPAQSLCIGVGSHGTVVATRGATTKVVNSGLDSYLALTDVTCPTTKLCVAIAYNKLLSTTNPGAAKPSWHEVRLKVGIGLLETITCPTASLCVALASTGAVWVSTKPTGAASAWKPTTLAGQGQFIGAVGCARASTLCVASIGGDAGTGSRFATTTNPAGGRSAWKTSPAATPAATQISCPSTALCVGISYDDILASTNPTAGGASWTAAPLLTTGRGIALTALDCASASRCTAAVSDGTVLTSSDPAGGTAAWTRSGVLGPNAFGTSSQTAMACRPDGSCLIPYIGGGLATVAFGPPATGTLSGSLSGLTEIRGLSCPSKTLCIGVDDAGAVLSTRAPTGAASGWKRQLQPAVTNGLNSVSCPRTGFCVAVGDDDSLLTSTTPASPSAWQYTKLPFTWEDGEGGTNIEDLGSISCATPSFCVATGSVNQLFVSTNPGGGGAAWQAVTVGQFDFDGFSSVSCPLASLCVAGDYADGRLAVSTNPARGWKLFRIAPPYKGRPPGITSVSCTRSKFCLASDQLGAIYSSSDPTAGAKAFKRVKLTTSKIVSISCRSAKLCVAIGLGGRAWASRNPSGGRSAWHSVGLDSHDYPTNAGGFGRRLLSLACAPKAVCVTGDAAGRVFSATG